MASAVSLKPLTILFNMMYAAYIQFSGPMKAKFNPDEPSMYIGKDSEEIIQNALRHGEDPYFVSGMFEMNTDWDVKCSG